MADRMDLVGFDKHCLIRPRQEKKYQGKLDYKRQEQKKTLLQRRKNAIRNDTPEKDKIKQHQKEVE